jgi:hypothetical protein
MKNTGHRLLVTCGAVLAFALLLLVTASVDSSHAQRSRGFYVVLGSFGDPGSARRRARGGCLAGSPYNIHVVDSDWVDGFRPGLWVVVAGPYRSQGRAADVTADLRGCVRDAYWKYGRAG